MGPNTGWNWGKLGLGLGEAAELVCYSSWKWDAGDFAKTSTLASGVSPAERGRIKLGQDTGREAQRRRDARGALGAASDLAGRMETIRRDGGARRGKRWARWTRWTRWARPGHGHRATSYATPTRQAKYLEMDGGGAAFQDEKRYFGGRSENVRKTATKEKFIQRLVPRSPGNGGKKAKRREG